MDQTRMFLSIVICFFSSVESVPAAVISSDNSTEGDRLTLLAIKSSINDGPHHVLSSWNESSLSFCKWKGVTCGRRHQRVVELQLNSQGLVGSLSSYLGNLTFLRTLDLHNNSFLGEIPPEIGRLHRLRNVSLYQNSFVGSIPANISHCTNLNVLDLGENKLVGEIPSELASLTALVDLVVEKNNLTGTLPDFIGNYSSLEILALSQNSLGGTIPNSVGQLKNLRLLGLTSNMFSGTLPCLLYNISSLVIIGFSQNQLTGRLPPYVILPNLQIFAIGGNEFSGTIPVSLFNASGLQEVDMDQNGFSGKVPVEVGNLKYLQFLNLGGNLLGNGKTDDLDFLSTLTNCTLLSNLDFHGNQFRGMLPNSIANLSNQLSHLYLGQNQIHGTIPSGIPNYLNLTSLGFNDNFFTGHIPFSLGMLKKLQLLDLSGNKFSGQLPSSIGNLTSLFHLTFSNNMLEGNIISDIVHCTSLETLLLSNNNLNGTIPEELIALSSKLRYLNLANNSFTGHLPFQLGNFLHLQGLAVSGNKMSGEIPSTIGDCLSLEELYLNGNFFQGSIPTSFKSLTNILILDLSMNNFSGKIPEGLQNLTLLQNLNLSFNNLEGGIPLEGVFKNISKFSVIGNYKLCGGNSKLRLPACHIQKFKKGKLSSTLKATLGIVISLIAIASFATVFFYSKKRVKAKPSSEPIMGPHFERVSYRELYQATDGFSATNLIGEGGFGSVYKGILHEDEGYVAIKVLNLKERGAFRSFMTECDALKNIRHRNLLKIISICSSMDFQGNNFKALVLKFMSNGNLENHLHPSSDGQCPTRSLTLLQRINIAIDIASALDYLHNGCETTIIHCDLKPSNIILDEDMTAHVGDFGLAKFLGRKTSNSGMNETNSGAPKGTIGYIPPEYGFDAKVSKEGDVYSFGILLLEMMTGKRPTDEAFSDGLTLHDFSNMALSLRVMDIVDRRMILDDEHDEMIINFAQQGDVDERVLECIVLTFKIGLECSMESQSKRIGINEAVSKLQVVKEVFIGAKMRKHKASSKKTEIVD